MSTASDTELLEKTLHQLIDLSQALLNCADDDLTQMQEFLDAREPLIRILQLSDHFFRELSGKEEEARLQPLIGELQAVDQRINEKLARIHTAQGNRLSQMAKSQVALKGYRFPNVPGLPGIESQG